MRLPKIKQSQGDLKMDTQKEIELLKGQNKYLAEELLSLINSFNQHALIAEKQRIDFLTLQGKIAKDKDLDDEEFKDVEEFYRDLSLESKLIETAKNAQDNFVKNWNNMQSAS